MCAGTNARPRLENEKLSVFQPTLILVMIPTSGTPGKAATTGAGGEGFDPRREGFFLLTPSMRAWTNERSRLENGKV